MTTKQDKSKLGLKIKSSVEEKKHQLFLNKFARIAMEAVSVLISLSIIWLGTLGFLMNSETVDLTPFKPHYEQWFSKAFSGQKADIKTYEARWVQERGTIEILAKDISVVGQDGTREHINSLTGEFAIGKAVLSAPVLTRLSISGGALTIKRDDAGTMFVGLGAPETYQNVGVLWAFQRPKESKNFTKIEQIQYSKSKVYFVDQVNGVNVVLDDIDGQYNYDEAHVSLTLRGTINKEQGGGEVDVKIATTPERENMSVHVITAHINPSKFAPLRGKYSFLSRLDALLDIEVDVKIRGSTELTDLSFVLSAGAGKLETGASYKPFQSANINASYNTQEQHVTLSNINIKSEALDVDAKGLVRNLEGMFGFDINIAQARLNPGQRYDGPIIIRGGKLIGVLDPLKKTVSFDTLNLDFGMFAARLSAAFHRDDNGSLNKLNIDGSVTGTLSPNDLLKFWPHNRLPKTRDWMLRSIKSANITNVQANIALDAEDLKTKHRDNEHMRVTFDIAQADVKYHPSMPPIRGTTGQGILLGNQFNIQFLGGEVGGVQIVKGSVAIPKFFPQDDNITVDIEGDGLVSNMMEINASLPSTYMSKSGILPKDVGGEGHIKVQYIRPVSSEFTTEGIDYSIEGDFNGVSLPVGFGKHKLNQGTLHFLANRQVISVGGDIKLGQWPGRLEWKKGVGNSVSPAVYTFFGRITREDLDGFGIGLRRYLGGKIDLNITGQGDGLAQDSYTITGDFSNTDVNLGHLWNKPNGESGQFKGQLVLTPNTGGRLENLSILAEGLHIEGMVSLARNFQLQNMELSKVYIQDFMDLSVKASPSKGGVLSAYVSGAYLNAEFWVDNAFKSQSSGIAIPTLLTMHLDKLSLGKNYQLSNASALFSHNGLAMQHARLKGDVPAGAFAAEITNDVKKDRRKIRIVVPDASRAALAMLGLSNTKGGQLEINGFLPPSGQTGGVDGHARLTNFMLIRAPAITQILSLASLQGLADTLGGKGLKFNELDMQFSLKDGVFKVRKARVSGPALGLTAEGNVGITAKTIDFNGVLVPSYTVNSLLGGVPLLGDILVGKKGEGMFALNYSIKGPLSATQVNVNPLSALTPGFLRRIFDKQRDDVIDPDVKELVKLQKREKDKN